MDAAIWQTQAEQQRFHAKNISESGENWNTASSANKRHVSAEHFA